MFVFLQSAAVFLVEQSMEFLLHFAKIIFPAVKTVQICYTFQKQAFLQRPCGAGQRC